MAPQEQQALFSRNHIQQVNIYREATRQESRTAMSGVKLTPTQKVALESICRENNIPVSTFIAQALDAYIEIYPFHRKILRHKEFLAQLLSKLS